MNQPYLTLKILTPEGLLVEQGNLIGIAIPLANGYPLGIRPGHAPLIAETVQGQIKYQQAGESSTILLHAGVVEIRDNIVIILTPGEVDKIEKISITDREYDRLMRTLIQQVIPLDTKEKQPNE